MYRLWEPSIDTKYKHYYVDWKAKTFTCDCDSKICILGFSKNLKKPKIRTFEVFSFFCKKNFKTYRSILKTNFTALVKLPKFAENGGMYMEPLNNA